MDERLEKALQTANFMASLNILRKTAFEEYQNSLNFYENGASFTANSQTIAFVSALIQNSNCAVLLDNNNIPIEIKDLKSFLDKCVSIYQEESEKYLSKYQNIKKQRNVGNLVSL